MLNKLNTIYVLVSDYSYKTACHKLTIIYYSLHLDVQLMRDVQQDNMESKFFHRYRILIWSTVVYEHISQKLMATSDITAEYFNCSAVIFL